LIPVNTTADGNRLFRSVSKYMYGTEEHHVHLHLLCVTEVCQNTTLYDNTTGEFYSQFASDTLLVLPTLDHFVAELCAIGRYCGFLDPFWH